MNGFDQLVWREWRRSRTILLVTLGIIVLLLLLVFSQPQNMPPEWAAGSGYRVVFNVVFSVIGIAAWIMSFLSAFLLPLIAANSLAGERADRSAEFIAPLPVSRSARLVAKVVLLAAAAIACWAPILSVLSPVKTVNRIDADFGQALGLLGMVATFTLLATALAWLLAARIESPVIAAVGAIVIPFAIPMVLFGVPTIARLQPFRDPSTFFGIWFTAGGIPQPLTFLVAAAFFAAGSAVYVRRLE
jgi:ABC-type transport system involved in multi-copper enzyme maturation permease subunit